MLRHWLVGMECNQLDKKLSEFDAMHDIASDMVTYDTIAKSSRQCGFKRSVACCTNEAAVPVDDVAEFGSLQLPRILAACAGADNDVAVCSSVSVDDIIEAVHLDKAETSDQEIWMMLQRLAHLF
ncbi:hypothetical protein MRX96_055057 [Rhipicephalus microplus]